MIGNHAGPAIDHDDVDAFTRFTWDGEVGYGLTERTVDRTDRSSSGTGRG